MALNIERGSTENGTFMQHTGEDQSHVLMQIDGQPGGVERGLGTPQYLLHLWDGAASVYSNGDK